MKKVLTILLIISMFFVCTTLVACGNNDSKSENSNISPAEQSENLSTSPVEQSKNDKEMLEEKGYTVYRYTSYLDSFDAALKVENGSVKAYIYAYNNDGDGVYIYYFKNEQLAKTAYKNADDEVKSSYKLKGNMLLLNDTTGLFD